MTTNKTVWILECFMMDSPTGEYITLPLTPNSRIELAIRFNTKEAAESWYDSHPVKPKIAVRAVPIDETNTTVIVRKGESFHIGVINM